MTVEMTLVEAELLIAILTGAEGSFAVTNPPLVEALKDLRPMRSALMQAYLRQRIGSGKAAAASDPHVPDSGKLTTREKPSSSSLPTLPASAWQPIEAAKQDGTVILAWGRGDGPGASPWVEKVCYFPSPDNAEDVPLDAYCWTFDADGCKAEPEGWMPLPEAPLPPSPEVK